MASEHASKHNEVSSCSDGLGYISRAGAAAILPQILKNFYGRNLQMLLIS
jgi:hypothetical protein